MEAEINNVIKVTLSIFASLSYCYYIASNIPKGKLRFISLLPIIFLFLNLPLSFIYLNPTVIASVFISWCANFKLILFAFDTGPLSSTSSLLEFISIAIFPIKINKHNNLPNSPPKQNFPRIWPIEVLLFAVFVKLDEYKDRVDHRIVLLMYCCMGLLHVDIVFGIGNAFVSAVLNMELDPPSDQPYFSTSLQDFWGRRWNLMITNLLRHTVYKPTRRFLAGSAALGELWSHSVAVLATFFVSGVMHELMFYHVTRVAPTWEVTCFFVLHGVCLAVEIWLKSKLRGKWELHWAVSGLLTVGFVVVTAMWLFFPPIVRTDVAGIAIGECKVMVNFVTGLGKEIFLALTHVW